MDILPVLKKNVGRAHRGKRRWRSDVKEILMLLILREKGPTGRYQLKDMINLSNHEGVVREMLVELKARGYVSTSRSGSILTQQGYTYLQTRLVDYNIVNLQAFDSPIFKPGPINIGVHLRDLNEMPLSPIETRDVAVRGGATGATTLIFREGHINIPMIHPNFLSTHPTLIPHIQATFNLMENDILVIISAQNLWRGFESSITLAKTISSQL